MANNPLPDKSGSSNDAVANLRDAENNALTNNAEKSYYTGNGKEAPTQTKVKGKKKGIGAIVAIALTLIGGGTFLGSSNSLLGPAMEALFTEATDTQYTSYALRTPQIMKYMLQGGNQTTVTWYGAKKYKHMSNSFQKRLASYGIEVEGSGTNRVLKWNDETISASDFINKYHSDVDFRDAYSSAKRGRVATFFDDIANKIYQKLGLSRNLFSGFKQTNDADADLAAFDKTMSQKFEGNTTNLSTGSNHQEEVKDSNGNTVYETNPDGSYKTDGNGNKIPETTKTPDVDNVSGANKSGTSIADAEIQAKSFVSGLAQKAATATGILDASCAVLKVANLISMAVAANEIYQSINYFMGFMENISKMKAGYGDTSAYHEVMNFLSTSTTAQVQKLSNGSSESKEDVTGAPLQSNGMQMVLADAPAQKATTQNYSLDRTTNAVVKFLGFNTITATGCALTQIAESALSMAVTIGTGGLAKIVGSFFVATVVNVGIATAVNAAVGFLVPTIAQALFTNVFETATGIPAGELFTKGASAANTRVGRSGSGQSLSSKSVATAFNQATNTVLAMDAEIDRKNLSPFDVTNKNTFLGSIAYSLAPSLATTKLTSITSLMRTASTALASIGGRASAEGENSSYMTTFGDCPALEEIGAVGDIYCNPVTTTDLSTIELDPDDSTYGAVLTGKGSGNTTNLDCDSDGNCKINNDSNLARYITYCDGRDSPFGVLDSGILSNLEASSSAGGFSTILNSIPIVSDVVSIIDGLSSLDPVNQGWATGANCVNSSENSMWDSEMKYYQRYVEDQRILEQMGAYEDSKNPVTAYEEAYEKEHPLDTTPSGILAHYSGMSKDDAEGLIALVEYTNFLNDYDASTRIAMNNEPTPNGDEVAEAFREDLAPDFDQQNNPNQPLIAQHQYIIYADVRNRSYAA